MTVRANKPAFNVREKLTELAGRGKNHRAFVLVGVASGKSAASVTAGNTYTISYDDVLQGDASLWNTTEPGGYAYYFKCPRHYSSTSYGFLDHLTDFFFFFTCIFVFPTLTSC